MEQFQKMAEGIWFLKVPFGPVWTAVVLIRGQENMLIDSSATAQDVETYVVPALAQLGLEPKEFARSPAAHGDRGPRGKQRQEGCTAQLSPGNAYSIVSDLVNTQPHLL